MMPVTDEPAFQTIIQSDQYGQLDSEKRKAFLTVLQQLTPGERQQVATGLNQTPRPRAPAASELDPATMQDTSSGGYGQTPEARQAGRAAVRGVLGNIAATSVAMALPATLPATTGPLIRTGVEALSNVLGGKASQAIQGQNPISWDSGDTVNAVVPPLLRGSGWALSKATLPGQKAMAVADKATAAQKRGYDVSVAQAEADASALNQKRQDAVDIYNTGKQTHAGNAAALTALPDTLPTEDFKALYAAVPKDTEVALANSRSAAQSIVDKIDSQFPGFKNSPLYAKAKGILNYGAQPAEQMDPAIAAQMRNRGQMPGGNQAPAEPKFQEAQQLLQDVGLLKRGAEASDSQYRGLVKNLDQALFQDIQATGAPGDALSKANRAYSRSRSIDDLRNNIADSITQRRADNATQVKPQQLWEKYKEWRADPFTAKNFSTKELDALDQTMDKLTQIGSLKGQPAATTPAVPDYRPALTNSPTEATLTPEQLAQPLGTKPAPPGQVQPVVPNASGMAHGIGSSVGYVAGHLIGPMVGVEGWQAGLVGGGLGGTVGTNIPSVISRAFARTPGGQQLLRNFTAGKQILTSQDLAYLEAMGRATGILK